MKTILLLTYTTSPYKGSEPSVSWNYIINMSRCCKIIVLYAMGKDDIDQYLSDHTMGNVVFYNIPVPKQDYNNILDDIRYNYNQHKWHYKAYLKAKELCRIHEIDVVHYLNPIGFREPGYCWKLNKPYVWGPIGGVHIRPLSLWKAQDAKGILNTVFRIVVHNALLYFSPSVRGAVRHTDILFSATLKTQKQFNSIHHKPSIYLPENGITEMYITEPIQYKTKLNLIWVGSICSRKALILLLKAITKISDQYRSQIHLDVVGDGNLRKKMERFCERHRILGIVTFHGNLPRSEVQKIFAKSHLHIISSLGEATTTVLFEAMSHGIPTMTLDHCGMAGVVCEKCGIKIPIRSYTQVVNDMKSHIERIVKEPAIITKLSQGVLECA